MGTICEKELDKSIEEHKWKIKILKSKYKNIIFVHRVILLVDGIFIVVIVLKVFILGHYLIIMVKE